MISVKKILSVCAAAALTVGTAAAFPTETTYAEDNPNSLQQAMD